MRTYLHRVKDGTYQFSAPTTPNLEVELSRLKGGNLVYGSFTQEEELHLYMWFHDSKEPNDVDHAFWEAFKLCWPDGGSFSSTMPGAFKVLHP